MVTVSLGPQRVLPEDSAYHVRIRFVLLERVCGSVDTHETAARAQVVIQSKIILCVLCVLGGV